MTHKEKVNETVNTGVFPLRLNYTAIRSPYSRLPIAYTACVYIDSIELGRLTPDVYDEAVKKSDQNIRLTEWGIEEAIRDIKKFDKAGRHIKFIAVQCYKELAKTPDLYERMKRIIEKVGLEHTDKLCLQFTQELLMENDPTIINSIRDLKLLGIKTMTTGGASDDYPIAKLLSVPVDYVMLDKKITPMITDRNKPKFISSLCEFIRSMDVAVIADGIENDGQITEYNRLQTEGYIPAENYHSELFSGRENLTIEEAVLQKEEEDEQ